MAPPGVDECHVALKFLLFTTHRQRLPVAACSGCKAANLPAAAEVREAVSKIRTLVQNKKPGEKDPRFAVSGPITRRTESSCAPALDDLR